MTISVLNIQSVADPTSPESYSMSYTVPSGENRCLVVVAHLQRNVQSSFSASGLYGSNGLTEVAAASRDIASRWWKTYMWLLLNPPVGTDNILVNMSPAVHGAVLGAMTLTGVSQSSPVGVTSSADVGSSSTIPLTLNGVAAGSVLIGAASSHSGGPPTWSWDLGTEAWDTDNGNSNAEVSGTAAYYAVPSAGNYTLTPTRSATTNAITGVIAEFLAAPGGGSSIAPHVRHYQRMRG